MSNGCIERFHRYLHAGLSHYVNATNKNWVVLVPFYMMAYRATLNTFTGYSPFYLLHGRELRLPSEDKTNDFADTPGTQPATEKP